MLLCFFILLFSVFGFSCAVWMLADRGTAPNNQALAVLIMNQNDDDLLDLLLEDARCSFFAKRARSPVVLISSDLMDGTVGIDGTLFEKYEQILDCYGADCYVIEP